MHRNLQIPTPYLEQALRQNLETAWLGEDDTRLVTAGRLTCALRLLTVAVMVTAGAR